MSDRIEDIEDFDNTEDYKTIEIKAGNGKLSLLFDFNSDFIMALKRIVPFKNREYNPETRVWKVDAGYKRAILTEARKYFSSACFIEDSTEGVKYENLHTRKVSIQRRLF